MVVYLNALCSLQELLLPVLFIFCLVGLTRLGKLVESKKKLNDTALLPVRQSLPPTTHILCSPNTSEISSLMHKTLTYLQGPHLLLSPVLSLYHSAAEAEKAYQNDNGGVDAARSHVIGIHFDEVVVPTLVKYRVRFRSRNVANTKTLFNIICE